MKTLLAAAVLVVFLSAGFTADCQAGVVRQAYDSTQLTATITPEPGEVGPYNVYMGAVYGGVLYLRRSGVAIENWQPDTGEAYPVAAQVNLTAGPATVTVANFDISGLACLQVYVGYGVRAADIWLPGHLAMIQVVPGVGADGRLCYQDKVYVTRTGGAIFGATKTGLTTVRNMTEFQTGVTPLGACSLYEYSVENGIIPVTCQVSATGEFRKFYIDPLTEEIHTYAGNFVFDESKFHAVPWGTYGNTPPLYMANDICRVGRYAEVAEGIYYAPCTNVQTLKFSDYSFATTTVVATGTAGVEGSFNVVMRFSSQ